MGAATGCTASPKPAAAPARHGLIGPGTPQVAAAEAARHATGGTVPAGVAPEVGRIDLGGPVVSTWSYGGQIPGPEIRVRMGQVIQALLVNQLPVETTVHWHGVAIRVAPGGHTMTITHTDGYPIVPVRADALLIGMGERYDVQVTLADGVFPLTALAEGKNATAQALIPHRGRDPAARHDPAGRTERRPGPLRRVASGADGPTGRPAGGCDPPALPLG